MASAPHYKIYYVSSSGETETIVVAEGEELDFATQPGFLRVEDSDQPGRTILIPTHRIALIEQLDSAKISRAYADADRLRRLSGKVIEGGGG